MRHEKHYFLVRLNHHITDFGSVRFVGECGSVWESVGEHTNRSSTIFFRSDSSNSFTFQRSSGTFLPTKKLWGRSGISECLSGCIYEAWWFDETPSLCQNQNQSDANPGDMPQATPWWQNIQINSSRRKKSQVIKSFRETEYFLLSHTLPQHSHTLPHGTWNPKLFPKILKYFPTMFKAMREADTNREQKIMPWGGAGARTIDPTF